MTALRMSGVLLPSTSSTDIISIHIVSREDLPSMCSLSIEAIPNAAFG